MANVPTFPSKEWFEMIDKDSNKESELSQVKVSKDPTKDIIRFLLNERDKFVARNR